MGNRRGIRKRIILLLVFILMQSLLVGYQIKTIPHNSLMIATNKGYSALLNNNEFQNFYSINIIRFPSNINFLNLKYNKFSLSFLNFGKIEDKIDNQVLNQFDAYEADFQYYFKKKLATKFLLNANIGATYSKISTLDSYAIITNLQLQSSAPEYNVNFSVLINNFGIVLKNYTNKKTILPFNVQTGIAYKLYKTSMVLYYDLIYNYNLKDIQHVAGIQFSVGKNIKINFSSSNYRNDLLIGNYQYDWLYGIGGGISIDYNNTTTNIGISNIGSAGLIYGISLKNILD